jgi:pimeloyl-ACP methyl ester carboxylesterase
MVTVRPDTGLEPGLELHTVWWEPDQPSTHRPWLLVHGLASNARLWDGVGRRLADAGRLAVAVDLRAHGLSTKVDGPFDLATVADDLALLFDALGWARADIAGQSWGGNVVVETVHRHPDRIGVVACVDGGFIELKTRMPDWDETASKLAPPRFESVKLTDIERWMASSAADWPDEGRQGSLHNFERLDDGTVRPWLTFDRHIDVLRGLWEHNPSELFPSIEAPVLMIGADSGQAAWESSKRDAIERAAALLPRGRSVWLSPAHHDVHAQQPDVVTNLLIELAEEAP